MFIRRYFTGYLLVFGFWDCFVKFIVWMVVDSCVVLCLLYLIMIGVNNSMVTLLVWFRALLLGLNVIDLLWLLCFVYNVVFDFACLFVLILAYLLDLFALLVYLFERLQNG